MKMRDHTHGSALSRCRVAWCGCLARQELSLPPFLAGRVADLELLGDWDPEWLVARQPEVLVVEHELVAGRSLELLQLWERLGEPGLVVLWPPREERREDLHPDPLVLRISHACLPADSPEECLLWTLESCAAAVTQRRAVRPDLYLEMLDASPSLMVCFEGDELRYINRSFLEFLGFSSRKSFEAAGRPLTRAVREVAGFRDATRRSRWASVVAETTEPFVFVRLRQLGLGGDERAFMAVSNRMPGGQNLVSLTDITRLEQERAWLQERAATDFLTGLSNRLRFTEQLHEELGRMRRYGGALSLMMFDIDDFKGVNDVYGHQVGDRVLVQMAKLLATNVRSCDKLSRWGGEEFLLLVPGCGVDECLHLADKLRDLIAVSRFAEDIAITCSFGVTRVRGDEELDSLLERVDAALYQAKNSTKNTVVSI